MHMSLFSQPCGREQLLVSPLVPLSPYFPEADLPPVADPASLEPQNNSVLPLAHQEQVSIQVPVSSSAPQEPLSVQHSGTTQPQPGFSPQGNHSQLLALAMEVAASNRDDQAKVMHFYNDFTDASIEDLREVLNVKGTHGYETEEEDTFSEDDTYFEDDNAYTPSYVPDPEMNLTVLDEPIQTSYPLYAGQFKTGEEARAWRKRERVPAKKGATDVENVKRHGRNYWVRRLYIAMVDISEIRDGERSVHQKRMCHREWDPKDIESVAHNIFDKAIAVHERGWRHNKMYHCAAIRGKKKDLSDTSVELRLAQLCDHLRYFKATVDDAIRGGVCLALLVDNPTARFHTKMSNNSNNEIRGERLAKLKKMEGGGNSKGKAKGKGKQKHNDSTPAAQANDTFDFNASVQDTGYSNTATQNINSSNPATQGTGFINNATQHDEVLPAELRAIDNMDPATLDAIINSQ